MMTLDGKRCSDCFYQSGSESSPECLRYPPVIVVTRKEGGAGIHSEVRSMHPSLYPVQRACGEFKPKKGED